MIRPCSYEKLGWIRTVFYSVRETWSHVIEMLHRYWLEVRFVFFTIFRCCLLLVVSYFFPPFGHFVDYRLLSEKNKIWNFLSSLSSVMFLIRETCMVLCATCIQVSCTKFLDRVSRSRNLDRLPSALQTNQICFKNTGNPTIVLVVQINNMVAHFTILFVLIVLAKFVQTPQVLCE